MNYAVCARICHVKFSVLYIELKLKKKLAGVYLVQKEKNSNFGFSDLVTRQKNIMKSLQ